MEWLGTGEVSNRECAVAGGFRPKAEIQTLRFKSQKRPFTGGNATDYGRQVADRDGFNPSLSYLTLKPCNLKFSR